MMRALLLLAAVLLACGRAALPPEPGDVLGPEALPLVGSPALRLGVEGRVGDTPALVVLDVARPLSSASAACFPKGDPPVLRQVRVPRASGGSEQVPTVTLQSARVGARRLGTREVALGEEPRCVLALGSDVLERYALRVDPWRREVALEAPRAREAWAEEALQAERRGDEAFLLTLTRDPVGDWPLVPAELRQGEQRRAGAFVLGTREPFSLLADAAGLAPERDAKGTARAVVVDRVTLSPGAEVAPLALEVGGGAWTSPAALGRLGPDVWGRFRAAIDVGAGVMLLTRPRVTDDGRCTPLEGGAPREDACYVLSARRAFGRLEVTGAVLRELPRGARVDVQLTGQDGQPLAPACRLGLTFPEGARGASTQHLVPWGQLLRTLPACAELFEAARDASIAGAEDGPAEGCPFLCATVRERESGRGLCECQTSPLGELPWPRRGETRAPVEEAPKEPEDPPR